MESERHHFEYGLFYRESPLPSRSPDELERGGTVVANIIPPAEYSVSRPKGGLTMTRGSQNESQGATTVEG